MLACNVAADLFSSVCAGGRTFLNYGEQLRVQSVGCPGVGERVEERGPRAEQGPSQCYILGVCLELVGPTMQLHVTLTLPGLP